MDTEIAEVLEKECGLKFPAEYYDAVDPEDFRKVYKAGIRKGIRMYAWWQDGVQYVGTTGRTLRDALQEYE